MLAQSSPAERLLGKGHLAAKLEGTLRVGFILSACQGSHNLRQKLIAYKGYLSEDNFRRSALRFGSMGKAAIGAGVNENSAPVLRHRTAIRRGAHSRPVFLALAHGLIGPESSFFDYGCGLGEDVRLLKARGVEAEGWDPYYLPDVQLQSADCVNLGYVLNVIEDQAEREQTLKAAFDLARNVLVVSVRIDQSLSSGTEFSDGLLTNLRSFQKIYTQSEFRQYLQTILGRKPYMAGLGIAYVFNDEAVESAHLARLSITLARLERADAFAEFVADAEAQKLLQATRKLGRFPLPSEFSHYPPLLAAFRIALKNRSAGLWSA